MGTEMKEKLEASVASIGLVRRRVFFTMVKTPTGNVRAGNAYASEEAATEWLNFVSAAFGGRQTFVEQLDLKYVDGRLSEETVNELDEKFNLDAA